MKISLCRNVFSPCNEDGRNICVIKVAMSLANGSRLFRKHCDEGNSFSVLAQTVNNYQPDFYTDNFRVGFTFCAELEGGN